MFAAWRGDSEGVRTLIATGADVNASCYIEPLAFWMVVPEDDGETMRTFLAADMCSKTSGIDSIGNNRSKESIFSQGKTKEATRDDVSDSKSQHSDLKI